MSYIIAILILIAFVVCSVFITRSVKKAKIDKEQRRAKDEENSAKMAYLRERKEQKRLERLAQEEERKRKMEEDEERRKLEEICRQEDFRKEQELQRKEMTELGVAFARSDVDEEEYADPEGYTNLIELISDENLNIDSFLEFVHKHEWEENSIIMHVQSSTGASLLFYIHNSVRQYGARIGEGPRKKFLSTNALRNFVWCFCQNEKIHEINKKVESILATGIDNATKSSSKETDQEANLAEILSKSDYAELFEKHVNVFCENSIALIEYELPARDELSWVKEYKYVASTNTIKEVTIDEAAIAKSYEHLLYSICLRSVYELCIAPKAEDIKTVVFNGFVTTVNRANGIKERKCILSLQVSKERFLALNLKNVDPKKCFKTLKGVSAAQLLDISPVQPVMTFNKNDHRFVKGKEILMNSGTNLASMDWEDFEHLVRELFEMEFSGNGGEVRVTQASRDGGVDAIVFDPDPLRGGKIVIQAKRYTNTVGVSAVRDLYGTVINEGANSGILITTSDYGHDSYEFAKDKPLKLLNGGHLLALLHKNGMNGYINISEAKNALKEEK